MDLLSNQYASDSDGDSNDSKSDSKPKSVVSTATAVGAAAGVAAVRKRKHETANAAATAPAAVSVAKKKSKVALPSISSLLSQKPSDRAKHENSALHDGRTRSFAHVPGNWPSHVFLPIDGILNAPTTATATTAAAAATDDVTADAGLDALMREVESRLAATFKALSPPPEWHRIPVADMHVSLSRTFALRKHQISGFVDTLRSELKLASTATATAATRESVVPFDIRFAGFEFYSNDERTRSFVALSIPPPLPATAAGAAAAAVADADADAAADGELPPSGHAETLRLIECTDRALSQFSLPTYYANPQPHLTFAWCLGDIFARYRELTRATATASGDSKANSSPAAATAASTDLNALRRTEPLTVNVDRRTALECRFRVSSVATKIGNQLYSFSL